MKITKYSHACLLLEKRGQQLLVDPGTFSFEGLVQPETFRQVAHTINPTIWTWKRSGKSLP